MVSRPDDNGSQQQPGRSGRTGRVLRGVLPLAVSVGILYYCLAGQDWQALAAAAARANLWLAIPAIVVPQLISWALGALAVQRSIVWFHGPFPLRTYFWVRGVGYILTFINSALGVGGLMLYQQRKARIGWAKLTGIGFFRVALGLWGIALVMIPSTLLMQSAGLGAATQLNLYAWWALLAFGTAWLVEAWLTWHHGISLGLSKAVSRGGRGEFWSAFRESKPRHWWLMWAIFLPQYAGLLVGYYFLNRAFGIDAPFVETLVSMPFAILVMDLPIAFAGFGTATLAWVTFFGAYGSEADITALTLALPTARLLTRALVGVVSLRPGLRDLRTLSPAPGPGS